MSISAKLFLVLSCLFLSSCYSSKKLINESKNSSSKFYFEKINGTYKNKIENNGLWNILADNKTFHGDYRPVTETSSVKLKYLNESELEVSLIENNSVIEKMKFKGKVVGDYFSIKKKLLLIPVPALFFHKERKTIIGNDDNGNLIITRAKYNAGWVFLFAADAGGITNYKFQRQ